MRDLYYADIAHCIDDPHRRHDACILIDDGALLVEDGHIVAVDRRDAFNTIDARIHDYRGALLVPGFIDTHVHYPQLRIIASYGAQLLTWLEQYAFPEEMRFADEAYAAETAALFLDRLVANGTTTALVFATVHPQSVTAFFDEAYARGLRMIAGKVLMDRHAPPTLLDSDKDCGEAATMALIKRWHGKGRLAYAVTPRFAPTSTPAQLAAAGRILQHCPDAYLHTHLNENVDEIAWVRELFADRKHYLDVYDHYGLVGERSVFAHCVHMRDDECTLMRDRQAAAALCPTSNLFIGSGVVDIAQLRDHDIRLGLGSDIGGGDRLSMLDVANHTYKIAQLRQTPLPAAELLYLLTLGGARALSLDSLIGNFTAGKEADFVVLDARCNQTIQLRCAAATTLEERLFAMLMLGDEHIVRTTYSLGRCVYSNLESNDGKIDHTRA